MRMPPLHPPILRHTYVTTMLDVGVELRDVQIAARHVVNLVEAEPYSSGL
jgi:integrase/recombinase XerD